MRKPYNLVECSRGDSAEAAVTMTERLLERVVENGDPNGQERLHGIDVTALAAGFASIAVSNMTAASIRPCL